ncbi:unnamed protein product, partial [Mesorhabditis belari]|uniref:40S ribosomal protein S8 n=1 Tax=Mesorhabditis belari TaxID=2138241 RepID=A0AAF3FJV8_9BILA
MGITRDSWHKRRATGGARPQPHDKRKHELGRPSANTKLGAKRVHQVRCRGGIIKHRALRLDAGNFSWASEGTARKTRILDTVRSSRGAIVTIDALPFRQWYENHYALPLARRKGQKPTEEEQAKIDEKKTDGKLPKEYILRQRKAAIDPAVAEQFQSGKLLARLSSSPGQVGRGDGYILEGKELEFYLRKLKAKKAK